MRNNITRRNFTLVELLAVMAVLSVLILVVFQFFSTAQKTWVITESKRTAFEDARIALDLISRDIECAYYGDGTAPFWHWKPAGALSSEYTRYQNGHLAFVADTPIPPNSSCTSSLCELKYQLYYVTSHDENEGWIVRSVIGNKNSDGTDETKWNFINNLTGSLNVAGSAFTANSNSSGDYQKLIPYVLELSFTCDTDTDTGTVINPDTAVLTKDTNYSIAYTSSNVFPSIIIISITLMDRDSWQKWISLQGSNVYHGIDTSSAADSFRVDHQVTFSKTIYLGDRGQE